MTATADLYCPACGRELPAGAAFCGECGTDLGERTQPAPAETNACLQCDARVPVAAEFCPSCGATMTADESLVPTLELEAPVAPQPTPSAPAPPRAKPSGRVVAIAAAVVVLLGGIAFALTSGGEPGPETENAASPGTATDPAPATPEPTVEVPTPEPTIVVPTPEPTVEEPPAVDPALAGQVQRLDALMQMSVQGRAAAVSGDAEAAVASRARLLRELETLRAEATDPELQAAVDAFVPAIRESLRQNRECGSACSEPELRYVGQLKREALRELNPLLREHVGSTYSREEI